MLRLLSGAAPVPIRLAAARAALPLAPIELIHALYYLHDDGVEEVRQAVATTLDGFGDDQLAGFLREPALAAEVLDFVAPSAKDKSQALEVLLAH